MGRRLKILVAALVALSPLLAGCMPDTPRTALSWDVNDSLTRHAAPGANNAGAQYAAGDTARTYVYQGDAYAVPAPKPRPVVTSSDLPPISSYGGGGSSVAFAWPVQGPVISGFGATSGGARNDGINIAAAKGTPIRAAAGGTVTYAGDELKDYGNLVLIKHTDGYVTAYAHADRLTVGKGDIVTKGQVIGYAGSTGDVSSPQLHFEIRHDTAPVDPRNLLVARNS
jgi:murein DD-endopeptidase MepM/ murein hydrolase activator NlpD